MDSDCELEKAAIGPVLITPLFRALTGLGTIGEMGGVSIALVFVPIACRGNDVRKEH